MKILIVANMLFALGNRNTAGIALQGVRCIKLSGGKQVACSVNMQLKISIVKTALNA